MGTLKKSVDLIADAFNFSGAIPRHLENAFSQARAGRVVECIEELRKTNALCIETQDKIRSILLSLPRP